MSMQEVDRFQAHLAANPDILSNFPIGGDVTYLAEIGRRRGYDFSDDELKQKLQVLLVRPVNDSEIDLVAAAGTVSTNLTRIQKGYVYTSSNIYLGTNVAVNSNGAVVTQVAAATEAVVLIVVF